MADSQDKGKEETKVEETKVESAPTFYLLKNVTRGRDNRTARAMQAGRIPFVQRFAGGTILVRRARPARISEAALKANLAEFIRAVDQAKIVVTTMSGRVVDLRTFEVAPQAAEKPLPNPPLDSAKNDKNQNIGYDVPPTPEGTTMDAEKPELVKSAEETASEEPAVPPEASVDPVDAFLDSQALPPEMPMETSEQVEKVPEVLSTPPAHDKPKGKGKRG